MLFLKKSFFSYHVNHDSNDEGHQNYKKNLEHYIMLQITEKAATQTEY